MGRPTTPGQGLRQLTRLRERAEWQTKVNEQMESIIIIIMYVLATTYLLLSICDARAGNASSELDEVGQPSLGKVDNKLLDKPKRTRICSTF